jgi:hypothetical protein
VTLSEKAYTLVKREKILSRAKCEAWFQIGTDAFLIAASALRQYEVVCVSFDHDSIR